MGLIKDRYRTLLLSLALVVSFAAFLPVLRNDFIDWDDPVYVTQNPAVLDLSPHGIKNIFTSFHYGLYKPLVIFSFAVENHFFGLSSAAFHCDNLLLHLCNVAVVFFIFLRLCASAEAAFAIALLFGIHPMHVESVAWIVERKDTLYALFFLLSFYTYLRYRDGGGLRVYALSCGLFVLSLMCKPMGVTLPAVLLLADYYKGRKISRETVYDKLFFCAAALFFLLLNMGSAGAADVYYRPQGYTHLHNLLVASYGFLLYVIKAFFPFNLSVLYPYPQVQNGVLPAAYMVAPLQAAVLCGATIFLARRNRAALFGFAFFAVTLAPGLQWAAVAPSVAFDHYSYVSYLGLFFPLALFLDEWRKNPRWRKTVLTGFCAVAALFCVLTWQRALVWRDSVTLWSDVLVNYPDAGLALNKRGYEFYRMGLLDAAIGDFTRAIAQNPAYLEALVNRGNVYARKGDFPNALLDYNTAAANGRETAPILNNRGNALRGMGRYAEAEMQYLRAEAMEPENGLVHYNLSDVYNRQGDPRAVPEYRLGLRFAPELAAIAPKPSGLTGNETPELK